MNALLQWLDRATAEQKKQLAVRAGTTPASLHQMSKAYRTDGQLRITPELAARLEKASNEIPVRPTLLREQLSPACSKCDLATRCRQSLNQD